MIRLTSWTGLKHMLFWAVVSDEIKHEVEFFLRAGRRSACSRTSSGTNPTGGEEDGHDPLLRHGQQTSLSASANARRSRSFSFRMNCFLLEFFAGRGHRDRSCAFDGESVDARRDGRKCHGTAMEFGGEFERAAMASGEQRLFSMIAASPDWPDHVDHEPRWEFACTGRLRIAGLAPTVPSALLKMAGPPAW
jgi:hypothetical protein